MKTVNTPYGPKTMEFLCKAMDAYELQPELLAALKAVLAMSAHGVPGSVSYHDRTGAMDKARRATAKAERD